MFAQFLHPMFGYFLWSRLEGAILIRSTSNPIDLKFLGYVEAAERMRLMYFGEILLEPLGVIGLGSPNSYILCLDIFFSRG